MSLRKKPTITEKSVAASQTNGKRSRGPATAEGRERIRDVHTRHGFYSQAEGVALRALGEKPEDFDAVVKAVREKYPPANGFDELLVMCLARALWGMDRGHRMQEGFALRQARDVNVGREDRLHAHMMHLKMTADSLRLLVQSVAREHYVTTPADLGMMKNLYQEGVVKEMAEIALALFYQLQAPGTDEDGRRMDPEEQSRRALARIKAIFGLSGDTPPAGNVARGSSPPQESPPVRCESAPRSPEIGNADATVAENDKRYPNISAAQWEARERPRQLLENILRRQVEICEAQRKAALQECLTGPSPYERAAEIAPSHPDARLMRRMQDSNFREVWRITNLLLKIKRQAREEEGLKNSARPWNVNENTAV